MTKRPNPLLKTIRKSVVRLLVGIALALIVSGAHLGAYFRTTLSLPQPDWRFVRSLGELQIVTRASYAMLVIVPMLAGVWNALPLGEPQSRYLPLSWVLAFFAALAVTLGQIIYQLRAPEIIRH